jgi:hypothetical protein
MLGCADQAFMAISAMALNAAIGGSILAVPYDILSSLSGGRRHPANEGQT